MLVGDVAANCELKATNFIKELMKRLGVEHIWNKLHIICMKISYKISHYRMRKGWGFSPEKNT